MDISGGLYGGRISKSEKFCPKCAAAVKAKVKVCPQCGGKLQMAKMGAQGLGLMKGM
jgi:ribosomal protein S27AE